MTDIMIEDITSITEVNTDISEATGAYDRMMLALRAQVKAAVTNQEITQGEAGQLLMATMPSIMGQAVGFVMKERATEVSVDNLVKDGQLKDLRAQAEQYNIDVLLVDKHNVSVKQQTLLDTEEQTKQYQIDILAPARFAKVTQETAQIKRRII